MNVNYKSDFDFILRIVGETKFPDYDWEARFYTNNRLNAFIASSKDGVLTNCFKDHNLIHIVVKDHYMGIGSLKCEFTALIKSPQYPEGIRKNVSVEPLNIDLVAEGGEISTEALMTKVEVKKVVDKTHVPPLEQRLKYDYQHWGTIPLHAEKNVIYRVNPNKSYVSFNLMGRRTKKAFFYAEEGTVFEFDLTPILNLVQNHKLVMQNCLNEEDYKLKPKPLNPDYRQFAIINGGRNITLIPKKYIDIDEDRNVLIIRKFSENTLAENGLQLIINNQQFDYITFDGGVFRRADSIHKPPIPVEAPVVKIEGPYLYFSGHGQRIIIQKRITTKPDYSNKNGSIRSRAFSSAWRFFTGEYIYTNRSKIYRVYSKTKDGRKSQKIYVAVLKTKIKVL